MEHSDDILEMSRSNPGAIIAMAEVSKAGRLSEVLPVLREENLVGCMIWQGYSDWARKDVSKFVDGLLARDESLLRAMRRVW